MTKTEKTILLALPITRLGKYELSQFIVDFLSDYDKKQLDFETDTMPEQLVTNIRKAHKAFSTALNQVKVESQTKAIKELDDRRDEDWKGFYYSLQAKQYARTEEERKAYQTLNQLVAPYRDIVRSNYEVASAKYKQLLEYLKDEKYSVQLETLGLTDYVNHLKQSQEAFERFYINHANTKLDIIKYDDAKLKKALESAYKDLADYCQLIARLKEDAVYQDMIALLNNSRKPFLEMINRRGKRDRSKKETVEASQG
ncbi:hypothetical protein IYQ92_06870 [Streptococcus sp. HF-1907]|uniref:DUF6261 family protein n=1 Tax=Streptococcus sp. HF-1907 TaxID=2785793 RepID=UPI00189EA5C6|nr:DUF6261 family protein [Streptococcus sp. HF-1907]MBF7094963.1 hypothetical protein [Streptococcus sp. HF-1907]